MNNTKNLVSGVVERFVGWLSIVIGIVLLIPNHSMMYSSLNYAKVLPYVTTTMIILGLCNLYFSWLGGLPSRIGILYISILTWGFAAYTTLVVSPLGGIGLITGIATVVICHCIERIYTLGVYLRRVGPESTYLAVEPSDPA
jgi:hypothetical protein